MESGVVLFAAGWYAVMGVVSAALSAWDKRRSRLGRRRVPERVLLGVDLLGGLLGGWIARRALRHKTRKLSFRAAFLGIAAVHAALWVMLARGGVVG